MKPDQKKNRIKQQEETLIEVIHALSVEVHPHHAPAEQITLDSTFDRDLGLDSLARVELISRVEARFRLALPEHTFAEAQTPRDLLRAIQGTHLDYREISAAREPAAETLKTSDVPSEVQTLVEILEWHVAHHPDRPHIQFYQDDGKGEIITYLQLQRGAEKVAASLQQHGLKTGDPVAIMLPTGREYFFSFFGILMAGGIPVPIYPPARPSQLEEHIRRHTRILQNCLAGILITIPEAVHLAQLLKSQVPSLEQIVSASELTTSSGQAIRPVLHTDDIAFIQYTSGSTGDPKGVALTHANLLANIRAMGEAVNANSKDVFVSWLPLYHDMGLIGAWLGSLYFAARYVVMSPLSFLARPERWLWAIHHYRGTLSASPNFGYEYCLHRVKQSDFKGLDLSSWRAAFNGAEAVSPKTLTRFINHFAPYGFRKNAMMPVYGLAESSVGLAFPPLERGILVDRIERNTFMQTGKALPAQKDDTHALRFVSSGIPLREHQIRIIDPAAHELPERQEGQLQFRGPSSTSGYFRNAKKTQGLFDGEWLNTGDLAYIANGELYMTGRIKDIIIRAGRNIYPDELETAIGDIPNIRKGCVTLFGSVDARSETEQLVILAETRSEDQAEKEKLRSEINSLSVDLIGAPPDEIVLAPPGSVLKTSSGKIRRAASREAYEKGEIGKQSHTVPLQIIRLALKSIIPQFKRMARYLGSLLYAVYSWSLFSLLAAIAWLAAVLLPTPSLRWSALQKCTRILARGTATPLTLKGEKNLPSGTRPYVVIANHASYLDSFALIATLPKSVRFVAKAELSKNFLTRIPLKNLRAVFVERSDTGKSIQDTGQLTHALQPEEMLLFFPEGTMTRIPGLVPFHLGAFTVAAKANAPVIPIVIRGTRSILCPGSWFPHRGAITIEIGHCIDPQEISKEAHTSEWDTAIALRDASRAFILRHCGEPDLTR
ncbi:MAG: AMP-binding protein [Campylobacterota bacterium]|nr:AMP-binding protein [Campylobacterota bacterium]